MKETNETTASRVTIALHSAELPVDSIPLISFSSHPSCCQQDGSLLRLEDSDGILNNILESGHLAISSDVPLLEGRGIYVLVC